jgi:hypothetical protein
VKRVVSQTDARLKGVSLSTAPSRAGRIENRRSQSRSPTLGRVGIG